MSAFGMYTLSTAAFEWALLRRFSPGPLVGFVVVIGAIIAGLTLLRHRKLQQLEGFRFEEEDPAAIFSGFQLSEGLAAAPEESRQLR
jgi:hypothetical protein